PAWCVSLVVHALVLSSLALVTFGRPQAAEFLSVLVDWADADPPLQVDPLVRLAQLPRPADDADNEPSGTAPGGRTGESGPIAVGIETATEQAKLRIERSSSISPKALPLDFEMAIPSSRDLTVNAAGIRRGKGFASGGGFGNGIGEGTGDGAGAQFF